MLWKTAMTVVGFVLATGAMAQTSTPTTVVGAQASTPRSTSSGYYWWLHPKLGMVKVDRATNAMITSVRRGYA
jgi:hypothetical protein